MRVPIPLGDKLYELGFHVLPGGKVGHPKPLALENAEPLFDLIQPRAMCGGEVELKTWMVFEPFLDLFAVMDTDVIAHHMDQRDASRNLAVEGFQKRAELLLTLAPVTLPIDLTGTGVKSRKQVQGAVACVFMFDPIRHIIGLRQLSGMQPWSGWQRCLFIQGEHDFMSGQRTRIERDELCHTGIEGVVAWLFGVEPHVVAPGLQLVGGEDTPDGLGRDSVNDPMVN